MDKLGDLVPNKSRRPFELLNQTVLHDRRLITYATNEQSYSTKQNPKSSTPNQTLTKMT